LIVDNSPCCLAVNPDNGILCSSYFGQQDDTELIDLLKVLREVRFYGKHSYENVSCEFVFTQSL